MTVQKEARKGGATHKHMEFESVHDGTMWPSNNDAEDKVVLVDDPPLPPSPYDYPSTPTGSGSMIRTHEGAHITPRVYTIATVPDGSLT